MGAPNMRRAVMRVPPEILAEVAEVAQRLHLETGLDYPAAAVVRGLLVIGLASLAGREHLAPAFVGARVKRGRKRGDRRTAPDVLLDQADTDAGEEGRRR